MKKVLILVTACLIFFSCGVKRNTVKQSSLYTVSIVAPNRGVYIVDTITIEDPIVITWKEMSETDFVCSKNNLEEILRDKRFYERQDVYILGYAYRLVCRENRADYPVIRKLPELAELDYDLSDYDQGNNDFYCYSFNEPTKFILALVSTEITNRMNDVIVCLETKSIKTKKFKIETVAPNLLYNRMVFPIPESPLY